MKTKKDPGPGRPVPHQKIPPSYLERDTLVFLADSLRKNMRDLRLLLEHTRCLETLGKRFYDARHRADEYITLQDAVLEASEMCRCAAIIAEDRANGWCSDDDDDDDYGEIIRAFAIELGCTPKHIGRVLRGLQKASPHLRRRLARMGITTTVDGEKL